MVAAWRVGKLCDNDPQDNSQEFERQYVPSGYSATSSTITSYSNIYASRIYVPVPDSLPSQINQPEPVERLDSKERVSQLEDL
ncbi:hypothetical protein DAPPUDRAFT_312591 [Daphnia pulex]|uniref:Uncharacterized protein n=1 Tax=Daphnia pulex TaxID=6669 RepID=E9FZK3_DAPPU|nr:hypothetical protein DAPPUDRAFT_336378 [Daphnia pulex]EFX87251.1 hypothetical protein DAPPUDRAFT_312591 [Daphnia pulex]|eukprot:EFX62826.1 hypothetical protein DAPPUDRAFT_336378 [Daphnia pulex]